MLINILEWSGKSLLFFLFHSIFCFFIQAVAGLLADARQLLSVARDEAKQYKYDYGVSIPVKVSGKIGRLFIVLKCFLFSVWQIVLRCICIKYTLYGFVRPFGCFILLAAYESDGPQLYGVEPSGVTYVRMF